MSTATMDAPAAPTIGTGVSRVGIIDGLDENEYHRAGGELSSTGAKLLLESPAKYAWRRKHPEPPRDAFDFGHVVHGGILGVGLPVRVVDAPDWRTKAARETRDAARAAGEVPMLAKDYAVAQAMVDAVQSHELAGAILADGRPEVSLFWTDSDTGVRCRGRLDWVTPHALVDVKTTLDASQIGFGTIAAKLRYDLQSVMYRAAFEAITGERLPFLHIAVEKEPPHLVAVHQLPEAADDRGLRLYRAALATFRSCTELGVWPDYGAEVIETTWPRWA